MGYVRAEVIQKQEELIGKIKQLEEDMFLVKNGLSYKILEEKHEEYFEAFEKCKRQLAAIDSWKQA